ncbi:M16 family metallopeptidase [Pollutimonas harenae]|uniref:Insulinase family protein n=1 Tax=Pollutimonas harenae TaxID=657015 RepID=A0A853H0Y8_9BURK|nr:pitrilysin family protein [Pollutimonas harenae]NYT85409.1 insulinase family protein [Pollutimonas harenae]TEA70506.1 insulinase family protein [Pollutimonas harenae]
MLSYLRSFPLVLLASILLLAPSIGQTKQDVATRLPAGVVQHSAVEGVTEYSLPNGLRVLLAPDASKPTTTVNMTYLVGARHENYGQTGMAHLLEHLLFRGTPSMRNALAEFSKRGLAANGSTTSDRTNYYASFAANPETLDWYLRWQADAMVNSLIAREDLDAEMTVVRNEMERGENSPFQVLMQQMQAAAFRWHNYGHSTIGARSDVENVDIAQLRAFYHQYYQPDNAVLIVSGLFDPLDTLQTIADAFGVIERPTRVLPPEYTVEPIQDGERLVTVRRHGGSPLIAAMFHAPAAGHPDFTALDIGVSILADTPSGRLYKSLVGNKLSTGVFGFAAGLNQPGYVFFGAELEEGMDQDEALQTLQDTLGSIGQEPFTNEELERIRNQWLTDWAQVYANPASLASALSENVADGDWRLFFLERDQVEHLQLEDVQRVTTAYLIPSNRTSGLYVPTKKPLRAPQDGHSQLETLLKGYQGKGASQVVEAFDPSPAHINETTQRTPLTLPNGEVKLALLPKPTRGNRVEAKLLIQFGDAESLKGQRSVSSAVADLLEHGTHDMSRQEIQDQYNKLQANVGIGGGAGLVVASLSTTQDNLPALVELVLHVIRDANFPKEELSRYQAQASTAIKNAMSEPSALASRALARHDNPWPRDDIRYTPSFEEAQQEAAALTRKQLVDFHSRFYGAGTIGFSAVGAFDPDAVKAALTRGLKGWQQAPAYQRISDPYQPVPAETFNIDTPDKANAFYLSTAVLKAQDTDPDYAALYMANYLLGGSETSRLWERIRVKDGLSYDVGSSLDISSYEPSGDWSIYAIHAPENTEKLLTAVNEELQRALKEGFTDEEVREGVQALLNYRRLARTRDGVLASAWINYLQLDRSFEWSAQIDEALSKLTAEQVNAALRKALDPSTFSTAIAADHSKQGKAQQ